MSRSRAKVLFVDDERRVLNSMRAMFRRDYEVHLANSGLEALEVLEQHDVDVIVSDQRMPGMTGVEVLKAFKDNAPRAMRILLTGYADREAIEASINEGEVFRYLTKPCPPDVLKHTVALAVEAVLGPQDEQPAAVASPRVREPVRKPVVEPLRRPPAAAPKVPGKLSLDSKDVELLVLSNDSKLIASLDKALEKSHVLHAVQGIEAAVEALEQHSIGVLITDIAINADDVAELTSELKRHVPELVTIVASDHSDAHRLIDLINGGQVFRFLLKPIKAKQTSIWVESAVGKHVELVKHPELLARHVVSTPGSKLRKLGSQLVGVASRVMRLRERFAQANG